MFRVLFEKGYLFLKFLFYIFWQFVILRQKIRLYGDEIVTQSLVPSSLTNSSTVYVLDLPSLKVFSAFLIFF